MAALIILLAISNPGMKKFKETSNGDMGYEQRISEYLIFSVYQRLEGASNTPVKYVGVLLNFYKLDGE